MATDSIPVLGNVTWDTGAVTFVVDPDVYLSLYQQVAALEAERDALLAALDCLEAESKRTRALLKDARNTSDMWRKEALRLVEQVAA